MKILGVGDVFIAKRLPNKYYDGFEEISNLIKKHDACFGNLETTVHKNEGYPSLFPGGGYAMASPHCLADLKEFGFNVFNIGNNHALDYSHKGLEATINYLNNVGLPYVGAGINIVDASMPKYVDCSDGRVAFIGVTSSFHDSDAAGPQGGICSGRPGVNPLRREEFYEVTDELYSSLREVAEKTGMNDVYKWAISNGYREEPKEVFLREMKFVRGNQNRKITHPLKVDTDRIKKSIAEAKFQADCVVVSIHTHQMDGSPEKPAEFIKDFCHECIDDGANIIFGHGVHELRGVEIYNGAPIFYGLGDFIFHNEMVETMPFEFYERIKQCPEFFDCVGLGMKLRSKDGKIGLHSNPKAWESVMASVDYKNNEIKRIEIYPISLGYEKGRTQRGWPVIDKNNKIINYFGSISKMQYGTVLTIDKNHVTINI